MMGGTLIYSTHTPHIITNSRHLPCRLSHLSIIYRSIRLIYQLCKFEADSSTDEAKVEFLFGLK